MNANWWLYFLVGAAIGYQMKVMATKNIRSKVSAIDGGLMMGAVSFFLHHLVTADHSLYTEHD